MNDTIHMSPQMAEELKRWAEHKQAKEDAKRARGKAVGTFAEVRAGLLKAFDTLPEKVELPFHLTPEGERWAKFDKVRDAEFADKLDRSKLPNPAAFDVVARWDGMFPGPCAVGATGSAKTRAVWQALERLYVRKQEDHPLAFAWFPVRRMVAELERYESIDAADEFFRIYGLFPILFVDDADKINWDFNSQKTALFTFYDWIYRTNKACVTTTNKGRAWWIERMGDAFARRLFDEAHKAVQF